MNKEVFIIGGGTYGAPMLELAELCGYTVTGFFDDDPTKYGRSILGKPIIGKLDDSNFRKDVYYIVAIGNNNIRVLKSKNILGKGGKIPSLMHPRSEISRYAKIGESCIIHARTYVWTEAEIGNYTILSPNVVIAHHTRIGEGGFISTGCNVGAGIDIKKRVTIGIGATIMTGVKYIGDDSVVGAGSVVIRDVEDGTVVAGVPAKLIRKITD